MNVGFLLRFGLSRSIYFVVKVGDLEVVFFWVQGCPVFCRLIFPGDEMISIELSAWYSCFYYMGMVVFYST